MYNPLLFLFSIPIFLCLGCNNQTQPAIPPTSGDFVKNQYGAGTAQVFGIDFHVKVDSRGASSEQELAINFLEGEKSSARNRFTLGDDIVIQLDSINESEVKFVLNQQNFGRLNVGDQVWIDDDGNVEVNGEARSALSE